MALTQRSFCAIRVKQDGWSFSWSAPAVAMATTSLTQEPVVSFGALGAGLMLLEKDHPSYLPLA